MDGARLYLDGTLLNRDDYCNHIFQLEGTPPCLSEQLIYGGEAFMFTFSNQEQACYWFYVEVIITRGKTKL